MRGLLVKGNGRPASSLRRFQTDEPRCGPTPFVACMLLSLGLAILQVPAFGGARPFGAAVAFWSLIFGASACARALAPWLPPDGRCRAVLRIACGVGGLMAWSQLAWLVFPGLAATPLAAAGATTIDAAVVLLELRLIYRAARDARSHHS